MALKKPKVKDAAESNPMTMCEYLGHFKQSRFMAMGHNTDGPGLEDQPFAPENVGASNLYPSGHGRIDSAVDHDITAADQAQTIDQILNKPVQEAPEPDVMHYRDPPRPTTIPVPLPSPRRMMYF